MIKKLLKLFFINKCAHCGKETEGVLCKDCAKPVRILNFGLCQRCGKPIKSCICKALDRTVIRVISAYKFEEPAICSVIYKLKSKGTQRVVKFLSAAMLEKLHDEYSGVSLDFVTYTPVSNAKLRQKGFDHAELLAREIAAGLELPLICPPFKRLHKPAQKFLSRLGRRDNAEGTYKLKTNQKVSGTALLIDDVTTTGATLSACAKLLCKAGAHKVYCLTAATSALKD
ncbi:MAG: ComF family protein [Oscillospiraceae bacterium]|nr:ComF family protein [Oscillospiraceae bacterium]